MIEMGASHARDKLNAVLRRVEHREVIVITRYGKPVAQLVPYVQEADCSQAQWALHRMRDRAVQRRIRGFRLVNLLP